MKIKFRGWGREVFAHEVDVIPVKKDDDTFCPADHGKSLRWSTAFTVYGKVEGLALSGAFLTEFTFTVAELRDWLRTYAAEEPEAAFELIASVQAEAIHRLAKTVRQA